MGLEKSAPFILSVLLTLVGVYVSIPFPSNSDSLSLFGAAATVASVFASFLGVCKAIILTIKDGPVWIALRESGYSDLLFSYLASGIRSAVLFAGLSIAGFFILPLPSSEIYFGLTWTGLFKILWVWSGFFALLTYVRVGSIFFKLLKQ